MLPIDEIEAFGNPNNNCYILFEKAIENLKDWYQNDFEFLDNVETMLNFKVVT